MTINSKSLAGTGKVFKFTFVQLAKNKANMITVIVLFALSLLSVPLMSLTSSGEISQLQYSGIDTVFISDETGLSLFDSISADDPYFSKTEFCKAGFNEKDYKSSLNENQVYVKAFMNPDKSYGLRIIRLSGEKVSDYDVSALKDFLSKQIKLLQVSAFDLDKTENAFADYDVNIKTAENYVNSDDSFETEYAVQLMYSILIMLVSAFAVTYIVRTVVEEKASKLVELLMVSVKPLALIVGKILAAMAYVFGMILLAAIGFVISFYVSVNYLNFSQSSISVEGFQIDFSALNIDAFAVISVIMSLILGYFTFAIISGLSASGCSSIDDIQPAMSASTMIVLAGYLASVFAAGFQLGAEDSSISVFTSLCPVISVFCAPAQYMSGNINIFVLLLSWVLQIILIVILAVFSAKVYNALIMYRGSRMKITEMLSAARKNSGFRGSK